MPLPTIPHAAERFSADERRLQARRFYFRMDARCAVREFSPEPVEEELLEACILTAGTAPSDGHRQPWRFIVVRSPALRGSVCSALARAAREPVKEPGPSLASAPVLIVAMALLQDGHGAESRLKQTVESVGIANAFLISALHAAGLTAIAHPVGSLGPLQRILGRPVHERPVLVLSVGYPASECRAPDLRRKQLMDISVWR